jgi:ATP-binding protein involved in chromosome partitioning
MDPRRSVVEKRLAQARRIVAFSSAKGGVGKTLCSCLAALSMGARGMRVGLLDMDFQGSSDHIVLGVKSRLPQEKEGLLPLPAADGVSLMSVSAFTGEHALPLRGPEVTDAILELLAVTIWGELDVLIIDMPPGIGDEVLDLMSLVPRVEALLVSTPSTVSVRVVDRLLTMLEEMETAVVGVIANMCRGDARTVEDLAKARGVAFLGEVPFDPGIEPAIGRPPALLKSAASKSLCSALGRAGLLG